MNKADRLVSDETELQREKDHIRKALQVNGYPDWMMVKDRMLDQLDPAQDEGVEEKDEVEQRVPPTTTALEGPCAPVAKKTYPVVLLYVKRVLEQLRRVFRSLDIPTYFQADQHSPATIGTAQGQSRQGESCRLSISHFL